MRPRQPPEAGNRAAARAAEWKQRRLRPMSRAVRNVVFHGESRTDPGNASHGRASPEAQVT